VLVYGGVTGFLPYGPFSHHVTVPHWAFAKWQSTVWAVVALVAVQAIIGAGGAVGAGAAVITGALVGGAVTFREGLADALGLEVGVGVAVGVAVGLAVGFGVAVLVAVAIIDGEVLGPSVTRMVRGVGPGPLVAAIST
jgi:hypothetical protein